MSVCVSLPGLFIWTFEWPLLTVRKSWITRTPAKSTAPRGGTAANPSVLHLPAGCSIVRVSSPASSVSCSRPGTHLYWGNDESIGSLRWDKSRMKLIVESHDWKNLFFICTTKQELSVISALILLGVWGDYLLYFQIPGCHGCCILQNHNFVSLTFPVAMPRLMMCAQATLQAPGLLPSAPVMKQFQQGQGWMVACSRGGQYHDENLGKNRQPLVSVD